MPTPDQKGPFIEENGRVRLSPLGQALASSKVGGNDATANRANASRISPSARSGLPEKIDPNKLPPGVTQADIDVANVKANEGDADASAWLAGLGIAAGVAAAGGVAHALTKRRTAKTMGANNVAADAASENVASTTSKKAYLPAKKPMLALPAPTPVITDQTASRYQQPAPNEPLAITDQNAAGRAKAANATTEAWRTHLGQKFKVKSAADTRIIGKAARRLVR